MLADPTLYLTLAASGLAGLAILTTAGLSGWRSWIALKERELDGRSVLATETPLPNAGSRIEIADLKERIRKLEAIAAGVDL